MKKLGFTYMFCNDLKAMKKFYQDLLQLDVIWDTKESIAFQIGEHQLSIEYHKDFHPPSSEFSIQPGWKGGTQPRTGWSISFDKKTFTETVQRLKNSEVQGYFSEPEWKGYWSYPVLDPMNNTMEITCTE